jgi:hypothetical protein
MLKFTNAVVFACVSLAGACAPTYQSASYTGGYEDYRAGADRVFVAYHGNGFLDKSTVVRYWHMRAAEICGGQDKYEVLQLHASGEVEPLSDRRVTTHRETTSKHHGVVQETTVTEERPRSVTNYDAEGYVRCANGGSYDTARQLWHTD